MIKSILAKIFISMIVQATSEKLLSRVAVSALRKLAKKTTNTLDDEIVDSVADVLGVPD